ncbi:MAG: hypothetical protein JW734_04550 [Candidatus Omnitrophica bacterium]|nr:hypothetical protein [Candidatus Omnitrophota bacterium]
MKEKKYVVEQAVYGELFQLMLFKFPVLMKAVMDRGNSAFEQSTYGWVKDYLPPLYRKALESQTPGLNETKY